MNLYTLLEDNSIKRIQLSGNIQENLDYYFKSNLDGILEKEKILFNGEYKVDENQVLKIQNFTLPFNSDFQNSLNIETLNTNEIDSIKSIIIINDTYIIFQTFDKRKIIRPEKWYLIYKQSTFSKIETNGLIIEQKIDALYDFKDKNLLFFSYHNASKIFDLSYFYREATDEEIRNFKETEFFKVEGEANTSIFNSRMRKKIYIINKNEVLKIVLEKKQQIKDYADSLGISFDIDEKTKKIIFPSEKKKIENLINFLNDDLYKSPITESLYKTNSKRKINNK